MIPILVLGGVTTREGMGKYLYRPRLVMNWVGISWAEPVISDRIFYEDSYETNFANRVRADRKNPVNHAACPDGRVAPITKNTYNIK